MACFVWRKDSDLVSTASFVPYRKGDFFTAQGPESRSSGVGAGVVMLAGGGTRKLPVFNFSPKSDLLGLTEGTARVAVGPGRFWTDLFRYMSRELPWSLTQERK